METKENNSNTKQFHIAMLPWFAFGHINPFIELSNKLISHGIRISFFTIPGNIPRIKSSLTPPNQLIPLTIPPIQGLHPGFDSSSQMNPKAAELLKVALDQMQPQLRKLLADLKPHLIFLDFAHYQLPSLASELGIKPVFFSVFSAVANSYLTVPARMSPTIDDLKKVPSGFPVSSAITSCRSFEARDLMYVFSRFKGPSVFERLMGYISSCDAFVYKTSSEMEGPYIEYIHNQCRKPVLLAGPLVPGPLTGVLEQKWANWLQKFAEKSVIFCNFGSETYLKNDQIQELALGLELTGLPFILVLNFGTSEEEPEARLESALPEGLMERVKERAVLHTGWVQQRHILAHSSVGCYVSHSGFSSVVEGIISDCQLVLVPQKGDQFLNSKLLSGELRVGVEVNRRDEDGYFGKYDVLEAVKIVMLDCDKQPGATIRANQKKWKEFLLDEEIQDKYIADLVQDLKALASK